MRTESKEPRLRERRSDPRRATLRVVDCARIYRKLVRGNLARRLLLKEARCIGTITAPITLYRIAHRTGKKKTEEANLWMYEASDFSSRDVSIYEIACIFSFFNRYIVYWWHRVFLHIFHAKNMDNELNEGDKNMPWTED